MHYETKTSAPLNPEKKNPKSTTSELGGLVVDGTVEVSKVGDVATLSRLRGKGLAIARKVESEQAGETIGDDNRMQYNHPEVFERLSIIPVESPEEPERVTYEIPGVGVLSLLRIDNYDGKSVLQVDIAEVDEDKAGQGFGTDMYRYVANHLPPGYKGILSGTITHEAIHRIYETLGRDPGLSVRKIGNSRRPSMYLLELADS